MSLVGVCYATDDGPQAPPAPLAFFAAAIAALVLAAPAGAADMLLWDNGAAFATFGANEEVVISLGTISCVEAADSTLVTVRRRPTRIEWARTDTAPFGAGTGIVVARVC